MRSRFSVDWGAVRRPQLSYQSLDHYHQGGVPTGVID